MNNLSAIGVFDSGIGGLTVLKQLIRFLPYEKYVYLGDTARVPYGNKSDSIVQEYARQCTKFLLDKKVKLIIIACNTVSAVAMETVRSVAGDVPVIGMIMPASAAAIRATINGKIGVIGTRATIKSEAYTKGINSLLEINQVDVLSQACPLFVPIVEEGFINHPIARLAAEEYLCSLKKEKIDTLVLGCTHYPLLIRLLNEIMPGVSLIDSGEQSSVHSLRLLAEMNLLAPEGKDLIIKHNIEFYVTDIPTVFFEQAQRFLGFSIDSPKAFNFKELE